MENKRDFRLETASIERASNFINDQLKQYKCIDRDIIRAQLFSEETILYWVETAVKNEIFQISIRKRFKTITLSLTYRGAQSNPLFLTDSKVNKTEFGYIGQQILIGLTTVNYTFENGCNIATFTSKEKEINPAVSIAVALIAAIVCGLTIDRLAPSVGRTLSESLLTPLNNIFFGLLNAIILPFLFVSVIASFFNMENIAQMKHIFRILFGWFIGLTVLAAILAVLAGILYFPLQIGNATRIGEGSVWSQIDKMLFDIVPTNFVKSFLEGNTMQIIFLAVIVGIAMLTLKGRFPVVTNVITEFNLILSKLLDILCSFMPWVIFTSIFSIIILGDGTALLSAIGVIGVICACSFVFIVICLLSLAFIKKENPIHYLKTIGSILLIALSTANSSTTYTAHKNIALNKQGIRDYLVNFSIPVGALFSKPFMIIILFLLSLFVGGYYQVSFNIVDILPMILLCTVLSIAVPPTSGMGIFLFTIAFNQFGIPMEGLALAATLYMFMDYLLTAGNVFSINISMLHTEHRLRKIEENRISNK